MATFFDATATAHLALIVKAVRGHDDLATVAAQVERDVLGIFTRRYPASSGYANQFYTGRGYHKGNGIVVALEGFNPDSAQVTDEDLKVALRDTIADVISWRLAKTGESQVLQSVSTAIGVSKSFRTDMAGPFPPTLWWARLKLWDLRAPVVSI